MSEKFVPTPEQLRLVSVMTACGASQDRVAEELKVDRKTLRKACRRELKAAKAIATSLVAESLFKKAMGEGKGAVAAAIFWMKTQAGWRETSVQQNQILDKDGNPIDPPKRTLFEISWDDGGPGQGEGTAGRAVEEGDIETSGPAAPEA